MTGPTVHHFDPDNQNIFVGSSVLDDSDLDPVETKRAGEPRYMLPGNVTLVAPPGEVEGFKPCFLGGAWEQTEYHGGQTIYDQATKRQRVLPDEDIGPLPDGWTLDEPGEFDEWDERNGAWAEDAEAKRASMSVAVTVERDRRLAAGYADATTGKTWQCDNASQGKWTAIGAQAMPWGLGLVSESEPSFPLIAFDNSTVTLTASAAYALFSGRVMPWVTQIMFAARALKDADPIPEDFADDKYWL